MALCLDPGRIPGSYLEWVSGLMMMMMMMVMMMMMMTMMKGLVTLDLGTRTYTWVSTDRKKTLTFQL